MASRSGGVLCLVALAALFCASSASGVRMFATLGAEMSADAECPATSTCCPTLYVLKHRCPHVGGTCCSASGYCCPSGYQCASSATGAGASCVAIGGCSVHPLTAACAGVIAPGLVPVIAGPERIHIVTAPPRVEYNGHAEDEDIRMAKEWGRREEQRRREEAEHMKTQAAKEVKDQMEQAERMKQEAKAEAKKELIREYKQRIEIEKLKREIQDLKSKKDSSSSSGSMEDMEKRMQLPPQTPEQAQKSMEDEQAETGAGSEGAGAEGAEGAAPPAAGAGDADEQAPENLAGVNDAAVAPNQKNVNGGGNAQMSSGSGDTKTTVTMKNGQIVVTTERKGGRGGASSMSGGMAGGVGGAGAGNMGPTEPTAAAMAATLSSDPAQAQTDAAEAQANEFAGQMKLKILAMEEEERLENARIKAAEKDKKMLSQLKHSKLKAVKDKAKAAVDKLKEQKDEARDPGPASGANSRMTKGQLNSYMKKSKADRKKLKKKDKKNKKKSKKRRNKVDDPNNERYGADIWKGADSPNKYDMRRGDRASDPYSKRKKKGKKGKKGKKSKKGKKGKKGKKSKSESSTSSSSSSSSKSKSKKGKKGKKSCKGGCHNNINMKTAININTRHRR